MANYDSILKEKKTYKEPAPIKDAGPKSFPWFKIDLICLTLLLIVSYIVYYNIILTPEQIFLNDLKTISDQYQSILTPLDLPWINNDTYNLKGTINLKEKNYTFTLNKTTQKMNLNLTLDNQSLNYYTISNLKYLKLSNFKDEYYQLSNTNSTNIITNLKNYLLNNLPKDKFIKKFYLNGTTPIVESNLILNNEDIKTALNLTTLDNSYEVLLTLKNNSLTNNIISFKITINNLTTNARSVILYDNNYLTYKDDNTSLKFALQKSNEDFTLKVYQNDILYSVLSGTTNETSYQYTYQVIDEIYNINLKINKTTNLTTYELTSNIEKEATISNQTLTLTLEPNPDITTENTDISTSKNYQTLTIEEQQLYQTNLDNIIGELRQFIKQYQ